MKNPKRKKTDLVSKKGPSNRYPFRLLALLIFSGLIAISCSEHDDDFFETKDNAQAADSWEEMFELLWQDQTIFVPAGSSIQEAVNEAQPGDVLLIEAGIYPEEVSIPNKGINLIGVPTYTSESVKVSNGLSGKIKTSQIVNIKGVEAGTIPFQSLDQFDRKIESKSSLRLSRELLPDGMVHYTFKMRVGGRAEDVIQLHRVVRELRPGITAPTEGAVFMVHGSSQGFEDIFLYPGIDVATPETSCPVFLANKGLDVWGIDLAWTQLPDATTDFSSMEKWGIDRDVHHTIRGMGMARLIRALTGNGFGRLNLLGFSYGGLVAYVAAGKETQKHAVRRAIKGLIPVDFGLKFAPEETAVRMAACNRLAAILELFGQGIFHNNSGQNFTAVGTLALNDPEGPSPIIPNFTNYQTAFFLGTNTFLQPNPNSPTWHFVGSNISEPTEIAFELAYTDPQRWLKLASDLPFFMPLRPQQQYDACVCGGEEVTIDDHLDQISLPILYLGAAGGTGESGLYTTGLTASTDISSHVVMVQDADAPFADFGHADLFMARDAAELAWSPLSDWLLGH